MTAAAPAPQLGADTGTAPEGPTAFRIEEKRYQLHREQHVRYRWGFRWLMGRAASMECAGAHVLRGVPSAQCTHTHDVLRE